MTTDSHWWQSGTKWQVLRMLCCLLALTFVHSICIGIQNSVLEEHWRPVTNQCHGHQQNSQCPWSCLQQAANQPKCWKLFTEESGNAQHFLLISMSAPFYICKKFIFAKLGSTHSCMHGCWTGSPEVIFCGTRRSVFVCLGWKFFDWFSTYQKSARNGMKYPKMPQI